MDTLQRKPLMTPADATRWSTLVEARGSLLDEVMRLREWRTALLDRANTTGDADEAHELGALHDYAIGMTDGLLLGFQALSS